MSELQIWLIALGAAAIVLLFGFNWWQDRRIRKRMQAHLPVVEQDPLLADMASADTRREPGLASEPYLSGFGSNGAEADASAVDDDEPDPSCEVVIELSFANPVSGEQLLSALHPLRSAGRKPLRIFAQDAEGHCTRRIRPDAQYVSMQVAVLLANRSGALTDIEWSQVWNKAQSIADHLEATVEGPDLQSVLDMAAKLEEAHAKPENVEKIITMGLSILKQQSVVMDREHWLREAEAAERAGSPLTCQAIVRAAVPMCVE